MHLCVQVYFLEVFGPTVPWGLTACVTSVRTHVASTKLVATRYCLECFRRTPSTRSVVPLKFQGRRPRGNFQRFVPVVVRGFSSGPALGQKLFSSGRPPECHSRARPCTHVVVGASPLVLPSSSFRIRPPPQPLATHNDGGGEGDLPTGTTPASSVAKMAAIRPPTKTWAYVTVVQPTKRGRKDRCARATAAAKLAFDALR